LRFSCAASHGDSKETRRFIFVVLLRVWVRSFVNSIRASSRMRREDSADTGMNHQVRMTEGFDEIGIL
jgi:hypothetical protein